MFDIAWSELLIVLIVAILVIGPKELPALLRTLGQMLGKLRRQADDFRRQFDEAVREAGGEDLQREMRALKQNNPLTQLRDQIEEAAREPYKGETPKPAKTEALGDDLGPPAPTVPQDGSAPAGEAAAHEEHKTAALPDKPAAQQPPSPSPAPKDGANGAGHELRVNGEHRPT